MEPIRNVAKPSDFKQGDIAKISTERSRISTVSLSLLGVYAVRSEEGIRKLRARGVLVMQYQVFLQNHADQRFVASVLGIPNLRVEGTTEAEAIAKIKTALEAQLATGKLITIEVGATADSTDTAFQMNGAGVFADDPTFDDWMEKLASIRRDANIAKDAE